MTVFLPVGAPGMPLPATFAGDPATWLPVARQDGDASWIATVATDGGRRLCRVTVGEPWTARTTSWRTIRWDPLEAGGDAAPLDRQFPCLDGELGLHSSPRGWRTLVLDARCRLPRGPRASVAELTDTHHVARVAAAAFLVDVAARLVEAATMAGHPHGDVAVLPA